jgi:hypothetical protein
MTPANTTPLAVAITMLSVRMRKLSIPKPTR